MENVNHWNEANTTALIQGVSGIAANIINRKNNGQYVSPAENEAAILAQRTYDALYKAQNPAPVQSNTNTYLIIGGVLVIGILLFIFIKRK